MLELSIQKTLNRHHILRGDHLLVGVSGGPDSVALLDALVKLGFKVSAAHFNHQLRPSADKESEFVRSYATRYGLEFFAKTVDIKKVAGIQKKGLEETARSERYRFLFSLAKEKRMTAVLTAHHADDQIETVIFNLVRGSGLPGLTGMRSHSNFGDEFSIPLIRPMLACWKQDILAYCETNRLDFVIDESNVDTSFTRNYIRYEIIPMLERINPKFRMNILQTTEILMADHEYIKSSSQRASGKIIKKADNNFIELDLEELVNSPVSIQRYLLKEILDKNFYIGEGYTFKQIEKCRLTLLGEYSTGLNQLTDKLWVLAEGKTGFITKDLDMIPHDIWPGIDHNVVITASSSLDIGNNWIFEIQIMDRIQVEENAIVKNDNPFLAFIDLEKSRLPLFIRTIKPGDKYAPIGMHGKHTKISDCFINRKIPRRFREKWPLVCSDSDQVIWIPGFQPSHSVLINGNTTRILKLAVRKKT